MVRRLNHLIFHQMVYHNNFLKSNNIRLNHNSLMLVFFYLPVDHQNKGEVNHDNFSSS